MPPGKCKKPGKKHYGKPHGLPETTATLEVVRPVLQGNTQTYQMFDTYNMNV